MWIGIAEALSPLGASLFEQAQVVLSSRDSLIVHLNSGASPWYERWAPSYVAIFAVLLGSFFQWRAAIRQIQQQQDAVMKQLAAQREAIDRQIGATIRSTARLRWIEKLRGLVAKMIRLSGEIHHAHCQLEIVPTPTLEESKVIRAREAMLRGH